MCIGSGRLLPCVLPYLTWFACIDFWTRTLAILLDLFLFTGNKCPCCAVTTDKWVSCAYVGWHQLCSTRQPALCTLPGPPGPQEDPAGPISRLKMFHHQNQKGNVPVFFLRRGWLFWGYSKHILRSASTNCFIKIYRTVDTLFPNVYPLHLQTKFHKSLKSSNMRTTKTDVGLTRLACIKLF